MRCCSSAEATGILFLKILKSRLLNVISFTDVMLIHLHFFIKRTFSIFFARLKKVSNLNFKLCYEELRSPPSILQYFYLFQAYHRFIVHAKNGSRTKKRLLIHNFDQSALFFLSALP